MNGPGDADYLVERGGPGEYLVCDAGGERGALESLARALSAVLAGMGIRHRLELYEEHDMVVYLHFGLPLD